uniref:NADH-ubiquinone oxidoreductase chain 6 n=1 Tax=Scolytinae sp. BMNH 1039994 TaxID=1903773 RepID=A0A343A5U7_9CUCU|nr:NADH dehydrogenase subunit 6 [Scolytinae sp. BMNH 1039994]
MIIMWTLSITFMSLKHPLAMGGILLVQTIMTASASGMLFSNFWFSYILFLIMVGGMLVMFIYMTSIASNEKFSIPKTLFTTLLSAMFTMMMITSYFMDKMMTTYMSKSSMHQKIDFLTPLTKFFNGSNLMITIMIMSYMLLTLIAIVSITDKKMGPLRQK